VYRHEMLEFIVRRERGIRFDSSYNYILTLARILADGRSAGCNSRLSNSNFPSAHEFASIEFPSFSRFRTGSSRLAAFLPSARGRRGETAPRNLNGITRGRNSQATPVLRFGAPADLCPGSFTE